MRLFMSETEFKKQPFDKSSFCFKYSCKDVYKAVTELLDNLNFEDENERLLEQCASLLTSLQQCEVDGEDEILISAIESMTFGLYQKPKTKKKGTVKKGIS